MQHEMKNPAPEATGSGAAAGDRGEEPIDAQRTERRRRRQARLAALPDHLIDEAWAHLSAGYRTGFADGDAGRPYASRAGHFDSSYFHGWVEGKAALNKRVSAAKGRRRP
jgi:hypothetical protein